MKTFVFDIQYHDIYRSRLCWSGREEEGQWVRKSVGWEYLMNKMTFAKFALSDYFIHYMSIMCWMRNFLFFVWVSRSNMKTCLFVLLSVSLV